MLLLTDMTPHVVTVLCTAKGSTQNVLQPCHDSHCHLYEQVYTQHINANTLNSVNVAQLVQQCFITLTGAHTNHQRCCRRVGMQGSNGTQCQSEKWHILPAKLLAFVHT